MHIHVHCGHGEAKFWMEPQIELAQNYGLAESDLRVAQMLIEERENEIRSKWQRYFGR